MVYGHTYGIFILVAQNMYFFIQVLNRTERFDCYLANLSGSDRIGPSTLPFPLLFGDGGLRERSN